VLQGMDGSGKSGTIKRVFAQTTPLGMQVTAFKAPTAQELARDFLWRIHAAVPPAGYIGIFDRSHYEDVLIARVRKLVPDDVIEQRYDQINAFEKLLVESGTVILKCMLNISFDEQGERLKERLTEKHKHWKFNPGDLDDRRDWKLYMDAYETAVQRCSTKHAPWYIIPSDSRTKRSAMIARLVRGALEDMSEGWPEAKFKADEFRID
jgi:PPK2 family polyphosphate:nucleotide phosphotransferase